MDVKTRGGEGNKMDPVCLYSGQNVPDFVWVLVYFGSIGLLVFMANRINYKWENRYKQAYILFLFIDCHN